MSEYMVDVGLQADVAGYVQGMGQAVAATRQYVDVADGLNGRLADLNKGFVGLTQRLTGFTKMNTVALDQAAVYQKQLSRIESSAAVTGRNFDALSKSTRNVAKTMTGNLGEAVQVVESLQSAGVKSEAQIDSLAKSFVRLGKATGTNAAVIGSEFMQLSRTMGNGVSQFDKLSDSLVSTTAKIGGSVPSVVAFSKALAPVAATVGLSQTAVIGLSTAMSKLGEDGYQSANSLNKVLLDMNRAIRDGGPELKAYADLMGMTSSQLRGLFKQNPAEVVSRFAEAVAKEGPNISRTLEALGFDSVRTTRSLTALARGGGPREAIAAATASYGDGSTAKAAEIEMDGLLDQSERLKESMTQVVRNVGAPLMGIAKYQLMAANIASNTIESATSSEPAKAVFGGLGVAGAGGSFLQSFLGVAGLAAAGKIGYSFLRNRLGDTGFGKDFAAGRDAARAGTPMGPDASRGTRAAYGLYGPDGVYSTAPGRAAAMMRGGASMMAQAGASFTNLMNANTFRNADGRAPVRTAAYQDFRDEAARTRDMVKDGTMTRMERFRTLAVQGAGIPFQWAQQPLGQSMGNLGGAMVQAPIQGARFAAGAGRYALGRVGAALSPLMPFGLAGMGVTAGIATGLYLYGEKNRNDDRLASISAASDDVYQAYNSFAEAAGMAGKGMASFNAMVRKTTQQIVSQNTTLEQAFKMTSEELAQSQQSTYTPAFKILGTNKSPDVVAAQALATLPGTARPEAIQQILMDIANQTSPAVAAEATKIIRDSVTKSGTGEARNNFNSTDQLLEGLLSNSDWIGLGNDVQAEFSKLIQTKAQQRSLEASLVFGGTANIGGMELGVGQVIATAEAKKLYETAMSKGFQARTGPEGQLVNKNIAEFLGLSEQESLRYGFGSDLQSNNVWLAPVGGGSGLLKGTSFDRLIMEAAKDPNAPGGIKAAAALLSSGYDLNSSDFSKFASGTPAGEGVARGVESSFNIVSNAGLKLADSLYGAEKAARQFGVMPNELDAKQRSVLSGASAAALEYEKNPTSVTKDRAASALISGYEGMNPAQLRAALMMQAEAAPPGYKQDVANRAVELVERDVVPRAYAGVNAGRQELDAYRAGLRARDFQASAPAGQVSAVGSSLNVTIATGNQAATELQNQFTSLVQSFGALNTAISQVQRSAGISAGAVARDAKLNEQYAREDFRIQRRYARADRDRSVAVTARDSAIQAQRARDSFNRSESYAIADFETAKARTIQGFDRQELYTLQDHNRQKRYLNQDYETQTERSTKQFNIQVGRANRDFQIGQTRAMEDFNRSRTRMTQDYGRQVARLSEDAARSMYDPYKRIAAAMVMDAGQLAQNLKDQTGALDKQLANLASAREMGFSEQAIKQLGLADAQNAQQLSRIVEDARQAPDYVKEINDAVASRASSSASLFKDAGNVTFSRIEEDFATSMSRGAEDFATSTGRAQDDFSRSMSDMTADFAMSLAYASADRDRAIARMDEQYEVGRQRNRAAFETDMTYMLENYNRDRERAKAAFDTQMAYMAEDVARGLHDMEIEFNKQQKRAEEALEKGIERMRERARNAISDIGAQAAAQIMSMKENFFGTGQNAADTLTGVAEQAAELLRSQKFSDLGDAQRLLLEKAQVVLQERNRRNYGVWGRDADSGASTPRDDRGGSGGGAGFGPDHPSPAKQFLDTLPKDDPKAVYDAWKNVGAAVRDGFMEGVIGAADGGGNGLQQAISLAFGGIIGAVKKLFGIESPSTVFREIGANIVAGLKEGISGNIAGAWEELNKPLFTLDIKGAVETAFEGTKGFLKGLDGWLEQNTGTSWNELWAPLKKMDSKKEMDAVFAGAKGVLEGLGIDVPEWIGKGYEGLWTVLPKAQFMMEKVRGVFEGEEGEGSVKQWLKNLPKWTENVFSGIRENIAQKFADGFAKPLAAVVDLVISRFNDLHIPPLTISLTVQAPDNWRDATAWLDRSKWRAHTFDVIKTPRVEFPNIGFGKNGDEPLSAQFPKVWLAKGGIVTGPTSAMIGEGGFPEAVIPLNYRGAEILAATMARYVDQSQAQSALVAPYSTNVTNYNTHSTYDQSTQFNGPITVKSNDPDEMAARLAARARRRALASPIGGR